MAKRATEARYPGVCDACGSAYPRGTPIKDSNRRGPRGGRRMVHAACGSTGRRSRRNPDEAPAAAAKPKNGKNGKNGKKPTRVERKWVYPDTAIPYGPSFNIKWGKQLPLAQWTSYPQYSYDQFWRANNNPSTPARDSRGRFVARRNQGPRWDLR